jgi:hypothetical protein
MRTWTIGGALPANATIAAIRYRAQQSAPKSKNRQNAPTTQS